MTETNMSSTKRARSLCETVHDVFQLTMQSQTRQLARASKEIATKESVRDQMRKDCERLGIRNLDKDLPPVVHIAGTKGKGSTCALLESILRAGEFRTGLFTSPHLVDVRERIRINGSVLPNSTFEDHVMKTYNLLGQERMETIGFFQFMTLLMFRIFSKTTPSCQNVDVLVLETGIGGRLDFTNALDSPLCCGITRLDYDHTEILGNTLTKIAGEKAGIIKNNVKVFTSANQADEGLKVIIDTSKQLHAPLEIVLPLEQDSLRIGIEGGAHQLENAGLAWAMADHVFKMLRPDNPRPEQVYRDGIASCRLPGRAQRELGSNGLQFYLDGAHTPLSVEYASKWFNSTAPPGEQKILIFHCSPDRDGKGMLSIIHKAIPDIKQAYMLAPSSGLNSGGPSNHESLALAWNGLSQGNTAIAYRDGPEKFRKQVLDVLPSKGIKHVLIIGSFYLVGDALKYWVDGWNVENAFIGNDAKRLSS